MNVSRAVVRMLKAEGIEFIIGYPVNDLLEVAAEIDIRPIIVRQERTGLHMADAVSRVTSGRTIGVFAMQHGPGTENAFGGVAQAWADSVPIVVLPAGYTRDQTALQPNFSAFLNYQHITKSCEVVTNPANVADAIRRAFANARNGRPRPALVELPWDVLSADFPDDFDYRPAPRLRSAPNPADVERAAAALVAAERPVLYAGQGVHYAEAWAELRELAELLEAPVTTSLAGKSAFDETHPLALGSGGVAITRALHSFVASADLICGIGCSFARTSYGIQFPKGKTIIHATLDPNDIGHSMPVDYGLVGDARLTLQALIPAVRERLGSAPRGRRDAVVAEISRIRAGWLAEWNHKLTDSSSPLSPYRVIWDLLKTVDLDNTIITHDAGSPRDQLSPFWTATQPLSYLGWGKTTQLGTGLGYAMGAKLARPEKLCINVWGDAAIGFTGMDFETAARERIPILSIQLNNFSMAIELDVMKVSTEKYRSTDISGNYADLAKALGGYGERVGAAEEIIPAIRRGIRATQEGQPALLEFLTQKETETSTF